MKNKSAIKRFSDLAIKWVLLTHLLTYSLTHCLYAEEFDIDDWQEIRQQKQEKTFQEETIEIAKPESFQASSTTAVSEPTVPAILAEGIELPYESKLAISGRKFIGMKFSTSKYLHTREDKRTQPTAGGFELAQQLQVRVKGTVKRKISVNVDYDDTVENKKDISIVYKGDPDEFVQEAAFGDISLSLPGTEFVSYGKAAFGAMAKLKYKKANAWGIFSRTKGTTETKRFRGATTFEKKEINDTAYLRRKYYKLALDASHIPIKAGSEKIYVDDRIATNNTILTSTITVSKYGISNSTESGTFDLLYPGSDYTIDYEKGIIIFRKSISQNYVIAVDYEKKDGTRVIDDNPAQSYKMIKDETETLQQYELKNYYSLGQTKIIRDDNRGNFILKIMDLARKDTPEIAKYPDNIEVDFETGTFWFVKTSTPFPPTTYATSPTRNYIIYTEYRYRTKNYLIRPNIVPQSEKILMDGKPLNRDTDYFIDYDSGFITFLNEEKISDTTLIDVTYEWAPFAGQMEQTVVGVRGEYAPFNNFSVGSTFLYNFPAKPLTSPDIHSTPESIAVYEFDTRTSFKHLPFQPSFSGEYAGSIRDPNTFGNAIIENMEGVKQADTFSTDDESWKYSANLSGDVTASGTFSWNNVEVKNGDINPSVPENERDAKQQVLNITYKLNSTREGSVIYPISKLGLDYTKKLFLEFWMYGDNSNDEITVSLGSLNEDADEDDVLDTEDKNSDGVLNPNEDTGIVFNHSDGSVTIIGANNGKIDTEDLDGDGVLRRTDNILGNYSMATFVNSDGTVGFKDESGTTYKSISWTAGWKHFIVPLGDVSQWIAVKQVRITVKSPLGNSTTRTMQFSNIALVGNKWEKPTITGGGSSEMTVTAINNVDNTNYTPLYKTFPSVYKDLYNLESRDLADKKEQALQLKYTLENSSPTSTATTRVVFSRAADYSKHKELTYFLWADNSKGATFSIQFGAESAYYEHTITPNWSGWKKIILKLVDINKDNKPDTLICNAGEGQIIAVGNPVFTNISQIKIIVKNLTGTKIENGEIWVNEIFLDDPYKIVGYAHRENADFAVPDWASFGAAYKYIDRDFQTLTTQIANRDSETMSGYFNMPQIWLLKPSFLRWIAVPLNTAVSKSITTTPSAVQTGPTKLVSILDEGKVISVSGNAATSVTIPLLPRLSATYSKSITETNLLYQRDETNSYQGTFDYTNPLKLYVTPNDLSGTYSRSDAYRGYPQEKPVNFEDLTKQTTTWYLLTYTNNYSGRTSFTPLGWLENWFGIKPFSNLSLQPTYKFTETWEQKRLSDTEKPAYPKSDSQSTAVSTAFRIFAWFQPSASVSSNINQTYNLTISTVPLTSGTTGRTEANTKTIDRTSGGSVSVSLTPRDIINFKPLNSLSLNSSYEIADGDSYENVIKEEYVYNKFFVRDEIWHIKSIPNKIYSGKQKSLTLSDTIRANARYSPFDYINFPGRFSPVNSITTTSAYSRTDRRTNTTGTESQTITTNWPDLTAGISETEKFFFVEKYVSDTQVNLRYTKRTTDDFAFKQKTKFDQSVSNSYDYRFNFIKKFDCFTSYSITRSFSKNIQQNKITGDGTSQSAAFQTGYRWKDWRFTPRYDWQKNYEIDGTPKVTKNSVSHTGSLGINYDVSKPITWQIPFSSAKLELKNRLTMSSSLKYARSIDTVVDNNNTDTYSVSISGDYTISDNLRMNLGSAGSYFQNRKRKQEDYYSMEISSSLTITF
ncbi:MAG: carbohydrate binding domain-containing protein [Elusimicrobiota bacterium]